ncbi:hypothetical protein C8R43DRAFT_962781 [Mycena crocata]|nr:hypothetical protein C8R43DRAFT_962781 [Mycena crocata]
MKPDHPYHSNPKLSAIFDAAVPQVANILAAWDDSHPLSLVPTPELEVVIAPPLAALMEHQLLTELADDERSARALGVGSALLQLLAVQNELAEPLNLNGDLISDLRDRTVIPCPSDGDKALEAMFAATAGPNSDKSVAWLKKLLRFKKAHTFFDHDFRPPTFRREYPSQSTPTEAISVILQDQTRITREHPELKRKRATQGVGNPAKKLKTVGGTGSKSKRKAEGELDDDLKPGKKVKVKRGAKEKADVLPGASGRQLRARKV